MVELCCSHWTQTTLECFAAAILSNTRTMYQRHSPWSERSSLFYSSSDTDLIVLLVNQRFRIWSDGDATLVVKKVIMNIGIVSNSYYMNLLVTIFMLVNFSVGYDRSYFTDWWTDMQLSRLIHMIFCGERQIIKVKRLLWNREMFCIEWKGEILKQNTLNPSFLGQISIVSSIGFR